MNVDRENGPPSFEKITGGWNFQCVTARGEEASETSCDQTLLGTCESSDDDCWNHPEFVGERVMSFQTATFRFEWILSHNPISGCNHPTFYFFRVQSSFQWIWSHFRLLNPHVKTFSLTRPMRAAIGSASRRWLRGGGLQLGLKSDCIYL